MQANISRPIAFIFSLTLFAWAANDLKETKKESIGLNLIAHLKIKGLKMMEQPSSIKIISNIISYIKIIAQSLHLSHR